MSELPPTPANLHGTESPTANLPRDAETTPPQPDWVAEEDATNPNHYRGFSHGSEVIDITENLTGNGAQAVKYIARATRLDGKNKGNQLEDLSKANWFIRREINRLKRQSGW